MKLPDDWEATLAARGDVFSFNQLKDIFGVSSCVVKRWATENKRFGQCVRTKRPPEPVDHSIEITDRLDDIIVMHERGTVALLISIDDLCQILFDARHEIQRVRDHKRVLLSEMNREQHAAHRRNSRGSAVHSSPTRDPQPLKLADLKPDTDF